MLPDQAVKKSPINGHHFQCAPLMRMKLTRAGVQNGLEQRKESSFMQTKAPFRSTNVTNGRGQIQIQLPSTLSIIYLSFIPLLNALVTLVSQHHFFIIAAACRP